MQNKYANLGILRLTPVDSYLDYSDSHQEKGKQYDENFRTRTGRKLMYQWESQIIRRYSAIAEKHLDFACGTGRITKVSNSPVKLGIDISESMLTVARQSCSTAEFRCGDFQKILRDDEKFDVITAFRFFPNADSKLRASVLLKLKEHLSPDGHLIFNNHRNFWSLSMILFRFVFFKYGQAGLSHKQIKSLCAKHRFKIVEIYSYGVVPQNENVSIFPWAITKRLDNLFFKLLPKVRAGYNVVYVLKHDNS